VRDVHPDSSMPARSRGLITAPAVSRLQRLAGPYAVLRSNRAFTLLFVAHVLSTFIDWLYVVALFILAYALTGSAIIVALLTFTRLLPYAALLPFSGAITDRVSPRRLMVAANMGRAITMLALTLVHSVAALPLAFLLVLMATTLSSLFRPALLASVPAVVPERDLMRANSLLGQVDMAAFGGGPALASLILLTSSTRVALVVAAVGLLISGVAVLSSQVPRPADSSPSGGGMTSVWDGLRFLAREKERVLLGIAIAWGGLTFFGGAYWALSVVLAEDSFHLGGAGVGFINASYAVGGLLGGFLVARIVSRFGSGPAFIVAAGFSSVAEAAFGLSPAGALPFLTFFLVGAADSLAKISATTVIQSATPRALLGRVFGAFESLFIFAMAAGALVVGPCIDALGPRAACVLLAFVGLALLLLAIPVLARLERALGLRVFLFQVPVLNLLPFAAIEEVGARLAFARFGAGETIVREGDRGEAMYLIKSGRVEVVGERDGREVVLAILRRADYFGEIALLEDVARTATCRAIDEVETYVLGREDFQELLRRSESLRQALQAEGAARSTASRDLLAFHG
jgi:MFS family permease